MSDALCERWAEDRTRSDLDKAYELAKEALKLTPRRHRDRGARLVAMNQRAPRAVGRGPPPL